MGRSGPGHGLGHGLGPHVVGTRVVVRRLVPGAPGPSGGPAFTDLLGTCVSWGEGRLVLLVDAGPAAGTTVTVPLADVVSGKPVPPRPSVFARLEPRAAHLRTAAFFPDLVARPIGPTGAWVARSSATHPDRGRATSVLAFGPSGLPDAEALAAVAAGPAGRASVLPGSDEEALLSAAGWRPDPERPGDNEFLIASAAAVRRALGRAGSPGSPGSPAPRVDVAPDADGLARASVVDAEGRPVAAGIGALDRDDGDWIGLGSLWVDEAHRRRGLGRAVLAALTAWGVEQGATVVHLQVNSLNSPALKLYGSLGFGQHHRYRYLVRSPHGL